METKVAWYLENRIILAHVADDNTIEDLAVINKAIVQYLEQGTAPIHLLIDVTEMGSIPSNIAKIKQTFTYLDHPSIGWSLFIGHMNAIEKFIVSITTQMSKLDAKTVDTIEDAIAVLNRVDATLTINSPKQVQS